MFRCINADCKDLKDQFFSSTLFKLMQSGSSMYNKGCVDEDMDVSYVFSLRIMPIWFYILDYKIR